MAKAKKAGASRSSSRSSSRRAPAASASTAAAGAASPELDFKIPRKKKSPAPSSPGPSDGGTDEKAKASTRISAGSAPGSPAGAAAGPSRKRSRAAAASPAAALRTNPKVKAKKSSKSTKARTDRKGAAAAAATTRADSGSSDLEGGVLLGHRILKPFPHVRRVRRGKKSVEEECEALFLGTVVEYRPAAAATDDNVGVVVARRIAADGSRTDERLVYRDDDGRGPLDAGLYRVRFDDGDVSDLEPAEIYAGAALYARERSRRLQNGRRRGANAAAKGQRSSTNARKGEDDDGESSTIVVGCCAVVAPRHEHQPSEGRGVASLLGFANPPMTHATPAGRRIIAALDGEVQAYWEAYESFHLAEGVKRPALLGKRAKKKPKSVGWGWEEVGGDMNNASAADASASSKDEDNDDESDAGGSADDSEHVQEEKGEDDSDCSDDGSNHSRQRAKELVMSQDMLPKELRDRDSAVVIVEGPRKRKKTVVYGDATPEDPACFNSMAKGRDSSDEAGESDGRDSGGDRRSATTPLSVAQMHLLSKVAVGCRISIFWPDDETYYPSRVTGRDPESDQIFRVTYDGGECETVDLGKEKFRLLKGGKMKKKIYKEQKMSVSSDREDSNHGGGGDGITCQFCSKSFKKKSGLSSHLNTCKVKAEEEAEDAATARAKTIRSKPRQPERRRMISTSEITPQAIIQDGKLMAMRAAIPRKRKRTKPYTDTNPVDEVCAKALVRHQHSSDEETDADDGDDRRKSSHSSDSEPELPRIHQGADSANQTTVAADGKTNDGADGVVDAQKTADSRSGAGTSIVPSDDTLRRLMKELIADVDLNAITSRHFMAKLSESLGGIDLSSKKAFIKENLTSMLIDMDVGRVKSGPLPPEPDNNSILETSNAQRQDRNGPPSLGKQPHLLNMSSNDDDDDDDDDVEASNVRRRTTNVQGDDEIENSGARSSSETDSAGMAPTVQLHVRQRDVKWMSVRYLSESGETDSEEDGEEGKESVDESGTASRDSGGDSNITEQKTDEADDAKSSGRDVASGISAGKDCHEDHTNSTSISKEPNPDASHQQLKEIIVGDVKDKEEKVSCSEAVGASEVEIDSKAQSSAETSIQEQSQMISPAHVEVGKAIDDNESKAEAESNDEMQPYILPQTEPASPTDAPASLTRPAASSPEAATERSDDKDFPSNAEGAKDDEELTTNKVHGLEPDFFEMETPPTLSPTTVENQNIEEEEKKTDNDGSLQQREDDANSTPSTLPGDKQSLTVTLPTNADPGADIPTPQGNEGNTDILGGPAGEDEQGEDGTAAVSTAKKSGSKNSSTPSVDMDLKHSLSQLDNLLAFEDGDEDEEEGDETPKRSGSSPTFSAQDVSKDKAKLLLQPAVGASTHDTREASDIDIQNAEKAAKDAIFHRFGSTGSQSIKRNEPKGLVESVDKPNPLAKRSLSGELGEEGNEEDSERKKSRVLAVDDNGQQKTPQPMSEHHGNEYSSSGEVEVLEEGAVASSNENRNGDDGGGADPTHLEDRRKASSSSKRDEQSSLHRPRRTHTRDGSHVSFSFDNQEYLGDEPSPSQKQNISPRKSNAGGIGGGCSDTTLSPLRADASPRRHFHSVLSPIIKTPATPNYRWGASSFDHGLQPETPGAILAAIETPIPQRAADGDAPLLGINVPLIADQRADSATIQDGLDADTSAEQDDKEEEEEEEEKLEIPAEIKLASRKANDAAFEEMFCKSPDHWTVGYGSDPEGELSEESSPMGKKKPRPRPKKSTKKKQKSLPRLPPPPGSLPRSLSREASARVGLGSTSFEDQNIYSQIDHFLSNELVSRGSFEEQPLTLNSSRSTDADVNNDEGIGGKGRTSEHKTQHNGPTDGAARTHHATSRHGDQRASTASFRTGEKVYARFNKDGGWYPATVQSVTVSSRTEEILFSVRFDDGEAASHLPRACICSLQEFRSQQACEANYRQELARRDTNQGLERPQRKAIREPRARIRIGHINGVSEGHCYSRRSLFMAGAHQSDIQWINGDTHQGADSIILTKSMPNSTEDDCLAWFKCEAGPSNGGCALTTSLHKRNPLRVFRSSMQKDNQYAPPLTSEGFHSCRYDGLYYIARMFDSRGSEVNQMPRRGGGDTRCTFLIRRLPPKQEEERVREAWGEEDVLVHAMPNAEEHGNKIGVHTLLQLIQRSRGQSDKPQHRTPNAPAFGKRSTIRSGSRSRSRSGRRGGPPRGPAFDPFAGITIRSDREISMDARVETATRSANRGPASGRLLSRFNAVSGGIGSFDPSPQRSVLYGTGSHTSLSLSAPTPLNHSTERNGGGTAGERQATTRSNTIRSSGWLTARYYSDGEQGPEQHGEEESRQEDDDEMHEM